MTAGGLFDFDDEYFDRPARPVPQPEPLSAQQQLAQLTAELARKDDELRQLRRERAQWAGQLTWSPEQRAFARTEHLLDFRPDDIRKAAFTRARLERLRQELPGWVAQFVAPEA